MVDALEGIKVLELTRVSPGTFCTMMLADMGAEVLGQLGYRAEVVAALRQRQVVGCHPRAD
jgi:hypothetical protein